MEHLINRKPARRMVEIPAEVITALEAGLVPSLNLVEYLATNQLALLKNTARQLQIPNETVSTAEDLLSASSKLTATVYSKTIAQALHTTLSGAELKAIYLNAQSHSSDFVRCWLAEAVGRATFYSLEEKLTLLESAADDPHFGVREMAWIGLRNHIIEELNKSITLFQPWVLDERASIRRFASEITRPRGVWCAHITHLKENPATALLLLEPLKSDSSLYVRNSVANWLNDASKTQPQWVEELCARWLAESYTKETAYIVKRALRTLSKN